MVWKKVPAGDTGATDIFGGDDMNKVSDAFTGVDVDDFDINADFSVRSGKRKLRNPANTFDHIETGGAITADRTVFEPILSGADTRVYQNHPQTLVNKTITDDLNTTPTKLGPSYVVYISGVTYKCRDMEAGTTLSSSTTNPETVINAALSNAMGKTVVIHEGVYPITAQLLIDKVETRLYMDPRAIIKVPQGYTGNAILMQNSGGTLSNCIIDGGRIEEAGTPQWNWTGIRMKAVSDRSQVGNRLSNTYIRMANNCIALETDNTFSWINSCTIENMYMDLSKNFITFLNGATTLGSTTGRGLNKNNFNNLVLQFADTNPDPLFGIKDISGWANSFNNVDIWDPQTGSKRISIGLMAEDTVFNGGMVTDRMYNDATYYTDRGIRTRFISDSHRGSRHSSLVNTPSHMQHGLMYAREVNGDGLLSSVTTIGNPGINSGTYDRGLYIRYTTPASLLGKSGWKQIVFLTARGWNFYMRTKVVAGLLSGATNCRVWIGFASIIPDPTGDNHYNNASFIGVGFRATDTDWQIISNDGAGPTSYTPMTGVTKSNIARTFEIIADDAGPGFTILRDEHLNRYYHNSDIPAQQTLLYPIFAIETTDSTAKSLDRYDYEIQAKRNF